MSAISNVVCKIPSVYNDLKPESFSFSDDSDEDDIFVVGNWPNIT